MAGNNGKNELIFDDVQLEPNTMMTVYHCPVQECPKRNYLDAKSVRTHCRRFHSMLDYEPIPSQAEAQFICQASFPFIECSSTYIFNKLIVFRSVVVVNYSWNPFK